MKNFFYIVIIILLSLLFLSIYQQREVSAQNEEFKDGIFIHVSSGIDEEHRVLMALSLAEKMSDNKNVILYFDIKGIEVLLNDAPDLTFAHFTGSHEQIQKLLGKDIIIMACPGCIKALGKSPEDLREGIQIADKEKFFNFTSGRIVSMNY